MKVYVVMRFDPMQCGACGNGNLDKIFMNKEEAEFYIKDSSDRRGVTWEIKEQCVDTYDAREKLSQAAMSGTISKTGLTVNGPILPS